MPLASPRDQVTQVIWGIRDFVYRFKREPEGMWLPETAVNLATLEILAEHGIRFTILAPHQAARIRPRDTEEWIDVQGGKMDPTRAFLLRLPSGRSMNLFFYDGPLSRAVAFEQLLSDGVKFASRLLEQFSDRPGSQLVHLATDGESYGHHHSHGDMALAYALEHIEASGEARLTCYGEFLEIHPPDWEVQIIENSSWSCIHGIERWRSDCGCNSGRRGWSQGWRGPLRNALDCLRDRVHPILEQKAGKIFADPRTAFTNYIQVVLDRTRESQDRFLDVHSRRRLDEEGKVHALELMELFRQIQLMYTSCGWFFDEISGLETTQILMYAGRVIQLAEKTLGESLESPFLTELEKAPSNLPEYHSGRAVYEKFIRPAKVEHRHVGAHYAVSSLFENYPASGRLFCYGIDRHDEKRFEAGKVRMVVGHATLTCLPTREVWSFAYAAIHFGDHNVNGGVSSFPGEEKYREQMQTFSEAFARVDTPHILRLLDRQFGESTHSVASLFRDEQRKVLRELLRTGLNDTMDLYKRVFAQSQPLMRFLKHLHVPLPLPLRAATDVLFNTDLRWAFTDEETDLEQIRKLAQDGKEWGVHLDMKGLGYRFTEWLNTISEKWRQQPLKVEFITHLRTGIDLGKEFPLSLNYWKPQNVFFELMRQTFPELAERAAAGNDSARAWVDAFLQLGDVLHIDISPLKKKLTELHDRPNVANLVLKLSQERRQPTATYRIQLSSAVSFDKVASLAEYLGNLGISDLYLSPILQARPGSTHGYDICDHSRVNPELGGEAGLDALVEVLRKHGMGIILDVVPNHMAIGHLSNKWWMDVLEHGEASRYSKYFDIDWEPTNPDLYGKVLLPTLGEQYGQALESGKLRLCYERGSFTLSYYEHVWPIAPRSYHPILVSRLDFLCKRLADQHEHVLEYRSILTALENLPAHTLTDSQRRMERYREITIIKKRLSNLHEVSADVRAAIESAL
ncbi:MAG: DUF3536 domain-containing protein, partial [Gemmataceae bacterium]